MPLPDTGKISHSMIQAEFELSGKFGLSADGGPLIEYPSGAPKVKESDFYGADGGGDGGGPIDPPPPPPPEPGPPVFQDFGDIPAPLNNSDILGVRRGGDGSCMVWVNAGFVDSGDRNVPSTTNVVYNPNPAANMKNWSIVPYKSDHSVSISNSKVIGCEWCPVNNCWIMHTDGLASINGYQYTRQGVHTIIYNTKNGKNPLLESDWGEFTDRSMTYHSSMKRNALQYVNGSMTILRTNLANGTYRGTEFWYNRNNNYLGVSDSNKAHYLKGLPNGNSTADYTAGTKQLQNGRKYIHTQSSTNGNENQTISYIDGTGTGLNPVIHSIIKLDVVSNTPRVSAIVKNSLGYWFLLRIQSNKLYVYRSISPSPHLPTAGDTTNSVNLFHSAVEIKVSTQSNGWDFINMTGTPFVTPTDYLMLPGRAAFFALDLQLPDEYWTSQQPAYESTRGGGFLPGFNYGEFTTSNFMDMDQLTDGSYISGVKGKIVRFV